MFRREGATGVADAQESDAQESVAQESDAPGPRVVEKTTEGGEHSDRLSELFREYSPRVFAYALRHCGPLTAEEVVSETFLVAWRRIADVPPDPLPWLLVVARNTISNRRRSEVRRLRLAETLARQESEPAPQLGADHFVVQRAELLAALDQLSGSEREALLLVAWDGLSPREAAVVAECSPRTFAVRLHRGRKRLAEALTVEDPEPARATSVSPVMSHRKLPLVTSVSESTL